MRFPHVRAICERIECVHTEVAELRATRRIPVSFCCGQRAFLRTCDHMFGYTHPTAAAQHPHAHIQAAINLTPPSPPPRRQTIDAGDDAFWEQFWSDHSTGMPDVFALVPSNEIRTLRHDNPANLATLCYKATERLVRAVDNSCRTSTEQNAGK